MESNKKKVEEINKHNELDTTQFIHYRLDELDRKIRTLLFADKYHRLLHSIILLLLLILLFK